MRAPDISQHRPEPAYLRGLLAAAGLSQRGAARRLGIDERTMRYYLAGARAMPYPLQYCLEALARDRPKPATPIQSVPAADFAKIVDVWVVQR